MNIKIFPICALAAMILSSCGSNAGQQAGAGAQSAEEVLPVVKVLVTAKQKVPQVQTYSSTVQANIINNIAPQTGGRIQKIRAEIGDFVSAGQILAEMDRVQLDQALLRLKNAEDELARIKTLFEEGGVSQSDYESMELSYKVAKSSCDNLEENTILRSPINGVVTARNYDKGDMYTMAQPLFTVQQITPVKLLVGISETDYTKVKKGDTVELTADALPGKTFTGSIVRLYPTMDAGSHTFNAEVSVRNADRLLRPGMFARATVSFGDNNSIVVPDNATLKQQGSGVRTVFVLEADSTVSSRVVTLGRHFDSNYEILSGLEEGEKVVISGQATLRAGQKVEVEQ